MAWFTQDALDFFAELTLNNEKSWFEANKKRYENSVKKPLEAFMARVIERMKAVDPVFDIPPKQSIFRIYRDVRFSKDKTPYKTHGGAAVAPGGKKGSPGRGLYFHFEPRRVGFASGLYSLEPKLVAQVRHYLAGHLDEFERELASPIFRKYFEGIEGERNKTLPADLKAAAERQPLLYNKQFYFWAEHDPETLMRDDLDELAFRHFVASEPMNAFLSKALATEV